MDYVHGYGPDEIQRLQDQALTLEELLHADTTYPAGATILEAGCGVAAQTLPLALRSPSANFWAVDRSAASLTQAQTAIAASGLTNVTLRQADIFNLPFDPRSFDHVFLCFVLEHLAEPIEALKALRDVLKPGETITVIEGDHGSAYFHLDGVFLRKVIG